MAEEQNQPKASSDQRVCQITATHDHDDADFRHQPLPDKDQFRLIEVLDVDEDGVRCQLTSWPIDNAPQYDAISYTWGDPNLLTFITINNQRLAVTQNCEYVLKQARWHGKSRYHWVDAICIDQKNTSEKNEQVSRMGDVYRDAQRVLACVGVHDDFSRFLFSVFRRHYPILLTISWIQFNAPSVLQPLWLKWLDENRNSTHRRVVRALIAFFQRPYFRRLWILQELFHGRDIVLCCGADHDDFKTLRGLFWLSHRYRTVYSGLNPFKQAACRVWLARRRFQLSKPEADYRRLVRPHMDAIVTSSPHGRRSLHMAIYEMSHLISQDPRDKVYGLLSMVDWGELDPIRPDYSKGLLSVYTEVVALFQREYEQPRIEDYPWMEFHFSVENALKRLGIVKSTAQELNVADATITDMITDMIEVRQSPWSEATHTDTGSPRMLGGGYGERGELCISFSDCTWQLYEPPASLMADLNPPDRKLRCRWRPYFLHLIVNDQGESCLVLTRNSPEPGTSILKLKGPQFLHNIGPVVGGLVLKKGPDGLSRVRAHALIHELKGCVLKYKALGFVHDDDGHPVVGTVVTKRGCRDGPDQVGSVACVLPVVAEAPLYGIRRRWEDLIKSSPGTSSGNSVV